jgi:hypothetical protein
MKRDNGMFLNICDGWFDVVSKYEKVLVGLIYNEKFSIPSKSS